MVLDDKQQAELLAVMQEILINGQFVLNGLKPRPDGGNVLSVVENARIRLLAKSLQSANMMMKEYENGR